MSKHIIRRASCLLGAALAMGLAAPAHAAPLLPRFATEMPPVTASIPSPPKGPVPGEVPADISMASAPSDPLEPVNRVFFALNQGVEFVILRPVNAVYRAVLPPPVRRGVSNVVYNLQSPVILANDVMQGEFKRASVTARRFLINSTVGLGGVFDIAAKDGLERHSEDFGQTMARWGVGSGPYLVLPVLGPSTLRDTVALPVDGVIDPTTWVLMNEPARVRLAPQVGQIVVYYDEFKDDADNLRKSSADYYASVRDIYSQRRQSEISNGDLMLEPLPPISGE